MGPSPRLDSRLNVIIQPLNEEALDARLNVDGSASENLHPGRMSVRGGCHGLGLLQLHYIVVR